MPGVIDLAPSLTATQQRVLEANPARTYCLLVNDSDAVCYIALGISAVANRGIRINASGGNYEINLTNLWKGSINAVSTGAAKVLLITEVSG